MRLYGQKRENCHHFAIASNIKTVAQWDFWGWIRHDDSYDNGYKNGIPPIISRKVTLEDDCGNTIETLPLPQTEMMYHDGDGNIGDILLHLKGFTNRQTDRIFGKYALVYEVCYDDGSCYKYYSDWFKDYECSYDVATIQPCLDVTDPDNQVDINGDLAGVWQVSDYPVLVGKKTWYLQNGNPANIYVPKIFLRNGFFYDTDYEYEFSIKARRSLKTKRTIIKSLHSEDIGDFYTSDIDVVVSFGKIVIANLEKEELDMYILNEVSMPQIDNRWCHKFHTLNITARKEDSHWRGCQDDCYFEINQ